MKKKKQKNKNYKARSMVYNGVGSSVFALSTVGSFIGYEMITDWSNFKNDLDKFIVINEETLKVNIMIALPVLIALVIYLLLWRAKNKKALEESGNISFGILIALLITYGIYSIVEVAMVTLAGAFVGSLIDSGVFKPLAKSAKYKAMDDHDVKMEERREQARKKMRKDDLSGSV